MAASRRNPFAQANALYALAVTPARTRTMRGLLNRSTAESTALLATTILCDYLNRWNSAGATEVALAEAAVEEALAADPTLYLAHYARGFLCRAKGDHHGSLAAFDETIRSNPDFTRAYAQRGEALLYLGRFPEAVTAATQAIDAPRKSSVIGYFHWVRGRAYFFQERDIDAIADLQASVRAWQNVWYNRAYLVSAHAWAKQMSAAHRVLSAFIRRFPGYSLAQVMADELANPAYEARMLAGRARFHEGLRLAGIAD